MRNLKKCSVILWGWSEWRCHHQPSLKAYPCVENSTHPLWRSFDPVTWSRPWLEWHSSAESIKRCESKISPWFSTLSSAEEREADSNVMHLSSVQRFCSCWLTKVIASRLLWVVFFLLLYKWYDLWVPVDRWRQSLYSSQRNRREGCKISGCPSLWCEGLSLKCHESSRIFLTYEVWSKKEVS